MYFTSIASLAFLALLRGGAASTSDPVATATTTIAYLDPTGTFMPVAESSRALALWCLLYPDACPSLDQDELARRAEPVTTTVTVTEGGCGNKPMLILPGPTAWRAKILLDENDGVARPEMMWPPWISPLANFSPSNSSDDEKAAPPANQDMAEGAQNDALPPSHYEPSLVFGSSSSNDATLVQQEQHEAAISAYSSSWSSPAAPASIPAVPTSTPYTARAPGTPSHGNRHGHPHHRMGSGGEAVAATPTSADLNEGIKPHGSSALALLGFVAAAVFIHAL